MADKKESAVSFETALSELESLVDRMETGDLIIAKLSTKGYEEIGRFHMLDPTTDAFGRDVVWSHPAIANSDVFARNDKEIVCVSLAAE